MLNAANKLSFDTEFDEIVSLYGNDFNPPVLKTQLQILSTKFVVTPVSLSAVREFLVDLTTSELPLAALISLLVKGVTISNGSIQTL